MSHTILATYDRVNDAQRAVDALVEAGFNRSDIGLAAQDTRQDSTTFTNGDTSTTHATDDITGSEGVGIGAVFGTMVGAVAGLAAIVIPGVGPVIAAGSLAGILGAAAAGAGIGAASGAITGGVTASLVKFGVSADDADYYAESLRRGSALVSVTVQDNEADRATNILQQYKPVNVDNRMAQWREKGWSKFDETAEGYKSPDRIEAERRGENHGMGMGVGAAAAYGVGGVQGTAVAQGTAGAYDTGAPYDVDDTTTGEGMGAVETDPNPLNKEYDEEDSLGTVRRYPVNPMNTVK